MSLSLYTTRVYYSCNQKKDEELGIQFFPLSKVGWDESGVEKGY
jgi:hypothetical protein